jgi:hypothetical protein
MSCAIVHVPRDTVWHGGYFFHCVSLTNILHRIKASVPGLRLTIFISGNQRTLLPLVSWQKHLFRKGGGTSRKNQPRVPSPLWARNSTSTPPVQLLRMLKQLSAVCLIVSNLIKLQFNE